MSGADLLKSLRGEDLYAAIILCLAIVADWKKHERENADPVRSL